jgi:NADH dehydrogenase
MTVPEERKALLTFVIVGAGPTGVELAGALSEVAWHTLKHDFRSINPTDAQILLVEAGSEVLEVYPRKLIDAAQRDLTRLHVTLRLNSRVTQIEPEWVTVNVGGTIERIHAHTILWAAGVQASPLGKQLASATGVETDRAGRVPVQPDLTIAGHTEIIVIGDLANCPGADGKSLPGLAPVAMQQGEYAARLIDDRLNDRQIPPFRYRDWGSMAVIGRGSAIGLLGRWKVKGFIAWLTWLFIHLMSIMQFQNRVLVLIQWGYTYLFRTRSARLITGENTPSSHTHADETNASATPTRLSGGST